MMKSSPGSFRNGRQRRHWFFQLELAGKKFTFL